MSLLHSDSSFARTPLFLQLMLVVFPFHDLLKFTICRCFLVLQLQPQCCLYYFHPFKCGFSGIPNCPFLAGSQRLCASFFSLTFFRFRTVDHTFCNNIFTVNSCIFLSQFLFLLPHCFSVSPQKQTKPPPTLREEGREVINRIIVKMW